MPIPGGHDSRSASSPSPVIGELLDAESGEERRQRIYLEQWGRFLSNWTDNVFEVPGLGWRFGLDPIIGLIPVVGDLATTVVSFLILSMATRMNVPRSTLARMTLNVGIDYVLGSIPLIGNVFDFAWKANQRNMQLLERALATPVKARAAQTIWDWLFIASVVAVLLATFVGSVALAIMLAAWLSRIVTGAS